MFFEVERVRAVEPRARVDGSALFVTCIFGLVLSCLVLILILSSSWICFSSLDTLCFELFTLIWLFAGGVLLLDERKGFAVSLLFSFDGW